MVIVKRRVESLKWEEIAVHPKVSHVNQKAAIVLLQSLVENGWDSQFPPTVEKVGFGYYAVSGRLRLSLMPMVAQLWAMCGKSPITIEIPVIVVEFDDESERHAFISGGTNTPKC